MLVRIDKIISASGEYSRSEVKTLIRRGRVTVDGEAVKSGSEKADPEKSVVMLDGERVSFSENYSYMLNKPAGYVTSTDDPRDKTVIDLLPERLQKQGLFPAGRLDKDSEGLLILTTDGDMSHRIMSPRHRVTKCYYVETEGTLDDSDIAAFKAGITLSDGYICRSAGLKILSAGEQSRAEVTISEGKYHQVKRMLASRGKPVTYLKRLRIGALYLDGKLEPGQVRELTEKETELLFCEPSE